MLQHELTIHNSIVYARLIKLRLLLKMYYTALSKCLEEYFGKV